MNDWILRMLGADAADVARIMRASLTLRGGINPAWVILLALGLGALVAWMYRGEPISLFRRIVLAVLRTLFLLLILGLLLRPVLNLFIEGSVRLPLIVLVDTSNSMKIEDPRIDEADLKRAAIATNLLDAKAGLGQPLDKSKAAQLAKIARFELMRSALRNPKIDLFPRLSQTCDLIPYGFGQKAEPVLADSDRRRIDDKKGKGPMETGEWLDMPGLKPASRVTAMGDSLRQILDERKGAGIFIVTDGQDNSGSDALTAAAIARTRGVPLYIYGVGSIPTDILVNSIMAQETASLNRELPVTVRVRGQQLAGQTARVILKLNDTKVDEQEITFTGDEDTVNLKFTPDKVGEFALSAAIDPRDDETDKTNNSARQPLRVVDAKPKVLLVEQSPRWEFKYLHQMLAQPAVTPEKKEFELKSVLYEGDPNITKGANSPFLLTFPTQKEELYKYDLLVLGDVDPKNFSAGQLEAIGEFVEKLGGSLIVVAGRRFMPEAYHRTIIEKMLPIEFDAADAMDAAAPADKPIKVELGPAGRGSPMMRLSDKEPENLAKWTALPPIYWEFRVQRAKPGADVLLVDSDEGKKTRSGKMPIIAVQQYGRGHVFYVGTDNLWRWRRNTGEVDYSRLWRGILQQMATPSSKSTQIRFDRDQRPQYAVGQRITVYAQLYSENFEPLHDPQVKVTYAASGEASGVGDRQVILMPTPNKPGEYAGFFYAPSPGSYQLYCDRDPKTRRGFGVVDADLEMSATAMNEPLLRAMAASTGGAFFREEDLYKLPETISAKVEKVPSSKSIDIWSSPLYFLVMLGVVTAEWVVRKFSQLK